VNPAFNARKAQGQPFSLNAVLTNEAIVDSNNCSKNGKCTTEVPLTGLPEGYNPCINQNWHPISFVASEFYGQTQLDWIDNKNVPQTIKFLDYCHVTLTNSYNPGQAYTCDPVPLP
jgi:hypothetical protein